MIVNINNNINDPYRLYIKNINFRLFRRPRHDIARSVTAKTGNHKLHGFSGPFAQRATDAHAQLAAGRCRSRRHSRRCRWSAVRPGKMAVRSAGQSGDRQWNNGLDASLEILETSAPDRMLGTRQDDDSILD